MKKLDLHCYYQNIRSIGNKLSSLFTCDINFYDVYTFTETWLNSQIALQEFIDISLFIGFRFDRLIGTGRGVLIALKFIYICEALDLPFIANNNSGIEAVGVLISFVDLRLYK